MKRKKLLSLLLASAMLAETAFAGVGAGTVHAVDAVQASVTDDQLEDKETTEPEKDKVVPDGNQYKYQKDELAAFCHFGPNTFSGVEWGTGYGNQAPGQIFTLSEDFDAETLVHTIKEAGFKKLIVTAKHHDGFCIWNSAYTEYDVANTNYKDGQGDILAEISAACSKEDIDMGLYLSPWDIHDKSFGYFDKDGKQLVDYNGETKQVTPKPGMTWEDVYRLDTEEGAAGDYNTYYDNQLKEILGNDKYGNKGHFVEVWMDGAKGDDTKAQVYDFERWFDTIQRLQGKKEDKYEDDCLLFGAEAYTTVRWIGNENGTAADETWSKSNVNYQNNTIDSHNVGGHTQGFANGNQWTVPEVDARITSGWFWGNGKNTPKSLKELGNMYFSSVGHNAPLLLNIPPNNQGKVDEAILTRVEEFGKAIKDTFDENLAEGAKISASAVRDDAKAYSPNNVLDGKQETYWTVDDGTNTGTLEIDLGEQKTFDVVSIEEAIQFGQRISEFKVEYEKDGMWKEFGKGKTVGAKRLARRFPVEAQKLRITVTTSDLLENRNPMITEVGVYKAVKEFEAPKGFPEGLKVIDDRAFKKSNGWNDESGDQYLEGTDTWTKPADGREATVTFEGTKAWLLGTVDTGHGKADIYIDGTKVQEINTNGSTRKVQQIIFESADLENAQHTLKIVPTETDKAIGLDALLVLDNGGKGMVDFEQSSFRVNEGDAVELKVKRIGGSVGEAKVQFQVNPGSAVQNHFDKDKNVTLTFAAGETEKTVSVDTYYNEQVQKDLNFYVELVKDPASDVVEGFNTPATVVITDRTEAQYTADNPFAFPTTTEETKTLEAELATDLIDDPTTDPSWPLKISTGTWASNGKFVNSLALNDLIKYAYTAKAGTYHVVMDYRSGSNSNKIKVYEQDGKITEIASLSAGSTNNDVTKQAEFDLTVTKSGAGTMIITAPDSGKGPQIDKFTITATSFNEHTVKKEAGEHGTIYGPETVASGADAVYTITPEDGYKVRDVKVNGTSVGAVTSYTMKDVTENMTISAEFEFEHYAETNRFVFPTDGAVKILEAEDMILHNDPSDNGSWQMVVSTADWCGNGKYVNAIGSKDTLELPYYAEEAGTYKAVVYYRSGATGNGFRWTEADNKITAATQTVIVGANDGAKDTHTKEITFEVVTPGAGVLTLQGGQDKAPNTDRFEISKVVDQAKDEYTVKVHGGNNFTQTGTYNTKVELSLEKCGLSVPAGKKFAGWREVGKEEILSAKANYMFFIARSVDLEAVFVDEENTIQQQLQAIMSGVTVMPGTAEGKSNVRFIGQLVVPEGYKLKDAGLVWASNDTATLALQSGAKETHISKISTSYQFSVTINGVPSGRFVRGKIFATVVNTNNGEETTYSAESKGWALENAQ